MNKNIKLLYDYLKKDFEINNHQKYHKYFDEWFNGITMSQICYFNKDMVKYNKIKNGYYTSIRFLLYKKYVVPKISAFYLIIHKINRLAKTILQWLKNLMKK